MKLNQYTKKELEVIVKTSFCQREVLNKLGMSGSGDSYQTLKNRLIEDNIDTSHFKKRKGIKRNPDNIFIINSTANQTTLRKWYKKGNYSEQKCSICGLEPLWQGKELTLILDHINGINNDDRLENLRWVCPNCNQQLDTTGSRNYQGKNPIKKYYCQDCGVEITKNAIRCISCASKSRTEEKPMTREELKEMIRTIPFTKIGEKYHCTDNNIRKQCDFYNLPRTKKEINSYTDEEWEKI